MPDEGLDARIRAAVARRGRRVLTIAELLEEGATYRTIEYRVGAQRWARVHPTVIDVGAGELTQVERVHAAVLAGDESAAAADLTAFWLYGLGDEGKTLIELSIRHDTELHLEGVSVRRRRGVIPTRVVKGVRCTTVEQTLLDVASRLPPRVLHRAFTRAWRKRLTTPRRMLRFLDERGGRGVVGSGKVRKVVAMYSTTDRPPGSDYEADLLFALAPALRKARIELPVLQFNLKIFDGRAEAVIDLAWPDRRKALEVMGLDTHGDYDVQDYDYERGAEIRALRWDLLEVAPKAIRERPDATVRRIIRWLQEPSRPLPGVPVDAGRRLHLPETAAAVA